MHFGFPLLRYGIKWAILVSLLTMALVGIDR